MAGPVLPDTQTMVQAGLMKDKTIQKSMLKINIKKALRIKDEQDAVNCGKWYNLPCDITSQELERMLYYKGQLILFYLKGKFYFMPYALDGTIDFYSRYNRVHPVPMSSGGGDKESERNSRRLAAYLSTIKLIPVYGVMLPEEIKADELDSYCVILRDYTNQIGQIIIPRADLNDPILDVMAEMIPFARTNLMINTGIMGIRVQNQGDSGNVEDANNNLEYAALSGKPYTPIEGTIDFQELTKNNPTTAEEYMVALQSFDNFRLSTHGIKNGGLFSKKAHMLQDEQDMMNSSVDLTLQDKTMLRQNFCNIANSIWGTNIWWEPSENETGADMNGDGVTYDRTEVNENGGIENGGSDDE